MNVLMEQRGTKIRRLALPAKFADVSSYGLPFSEKLLAEKPDLVARFGRAIAKGAIACVANPQGCLAAYWKDQSEQKPVDMNDDVRAKQIDLMMARLNKMLPSPSQPDIGAFSDRDWTTTMTALHDGGQIPGAAVDLASLYTNALVADFNKFDRDEVTKRAQAYGTGQ